MNSTSKIYFPNLNGLRFIAAFLVIIHHLEQFLSIFGKNNSWNNPTIQIIGKLGVTLFFVLSGFLITYLLLVEDRSVGTINIKDFYIRRILRIWPLYYTVVLAAFFILPNISVIAIPNLMNDINEHFGFYFLLFLFFLPNLALQGYGAVLPYASQSWSVGVEEQFYLIWPLLMKFVKNKMKLLLGVIFVYFFIQQVGFRFVKHFIGWNREMDILYYFFYSFQIYSMAVGGIFAYLAFKKQQNDTINKYILNNYTFIIVFVATVILIGRAYPFTLLGYSLLFGILIYNFACNKNLKNILEWKPLSYLGKISYGLYMYHPLAIVISIVIFDKVNLLQYHILLLIASTLLSVFIAGISYRFMERYFIIRKKKFSKIISGDNAYLT